MGPVLYLRGLDASGLSVALVVARESTAPVPVLSVDNSSGSEASLSPTCLAERLGSRIYRFEFELPAIEGATYRLDGEAYAVNAAFGGDLRIAFVSCNGQEDGDLDTGAEVRNAMWARLMRDHAARPFNLLLHGGDQIYADEVVDAVAPLRRWGREARTAGARCTATTTLRETLTDRLFARYLAIFRQPEFARLSATVPSLAIWDDHDICDGWGSLSERRLDSPTGRTVFDVARELFVLFQYGASPAKLPAMCPDRTGRSLGWRVDLPGLHLLAPDLRSERRPRRVMGDAGWDAFRGPLTANTDGQVFLLSSVPALGPRLSWVEKLLSFVPAMQKYEDDLRDQWQSRSHREEWKTFLRHLIDLQESRDTRVTLLSGEIHLATRATLATAAGPMHQLVASGIAHPAPPQAYASGLGALARLGESPLPDHPIRLHPLPGKSAIYTAQRNYLVLERSADRWSAYWELEKDGPTPPLSLDEPIA